MTRMPVPPGTTLEDVEDTAWNAASAYRNTLAALSATMLARLEEKIRTSGAAARHLIDGGK